MLLFSECRTTLRPNGMRFADIFGQICRHFQQHHKTKYTAVLKASIAGRNYYLKT